MRSIIFLCTVGISIFLALGILSLVNLNTDSNINIDQNNVREALADKDSQSKSLEVLNHQMTKTFMGNWVVKGQILNNGANKIQCAMINVNFFDKYGNLLYTGPVTINNIKPGEKKDFEVTFYGPNNKLNYYKIVSDIMA